MAYGHLLISKTRRDATNTRPLNNLYIPTNLTPQIKTTPNAVSHTHTQVGMFSRARDPPSSFPRRVPAPPSPWERPGAPPPGAHPPSLLPPRGHPGSVPGRPRPPPRARPALFSSPGSLPRRIWFSCFFTMHTPSSVDQEMQLFKRPYFLQQNVPFWCISQGSYPPMMFQIKCPCPRFLFIYIQNYRQKKLSTKKITKNGFKKIFRICDLREIFSSRPSKFENPSFFDILKDCVGLSNSSLPELGGGVASVEGRGRLRSPGCDARRIPVPPRPRLPSRPYPPPTTTLRTPHIPYPPR